MIPHDPTISSLLKLPAGSLMVDEKFELSKLSLDWFINGHDGHGRWRGLLAPRVEVFLCLFVFKQDAWRNEAPELRNIYFLTLEVLNFPSLIIHQKCFKQV